MPVLGSERAISPDIIRKIRYFTRSAYRIPITSLPGIITPANNLQVRQNSSIALFSCCLKQPMALSHIRQAFEGNSSKGHSSNRDANWAISPTPPLWTLEQGASSVEVLSKWLKATCMETSLLEDSHCWQGKKSLCTRMLIVVNWSSSSVGVDVENSYGERMQSDRERLQQCVTKNTINHSTASLDRALKACGALF